MACYPSENGVDGMPQLRERDSEALGEAAAAGQDVD
jgi:hypothetical protein